MTIHYIIWYEQINYHMYQIFDLDGGFNSTFLYFFLFISFFSGILVITTKNPIVSVLYLILLFSCMSCYLIFLGLKFLGLSYLLVYVGAVSILFLFILMLINIRVSELIYNTSNTIPLSILSLIAIYVPISDVLPLNKIVLTGQNFVYYVSSHNWDNTITDVSDITSIGNIMYTSHSMWLMITSIILLLAMVGSIIITVKQKY